MYYMFNLFVYCNKYSFDLLQLFSPIKDVTLNLMRNAHSIDFTNVVLGSNIFYIVRLNGTDEFIRSEHFN